MKLELLIPHYTASFTVMEPLLDSVAIQQAVDFKEIGVIIADDGPEASELPDKEWSKKYPFTIKHIKSKKHQGVSAARNLAFDNSSADYVMFCDEDDIFCDVCGLYIIFQEMKQGFDTLVSNFREESRPGLIFAGKENKFSSMLNKFQEEQIDSNEVIYINREMDSTFVHGKIHRRQYLIDKKIRWNPNLTVHEDSFFNILCQNLTEEVKYCPHPFYLWKWREDSVCRHDPKYILKTYNNMLDSNDALVDEFIKRGMEDKAVFYVCFMIFDAYYIMNKQEWIDNTNKEYRDAVEKRFHRYFKKHKIQWNKPTEQEKAMISNGVRTRTVGEGMLMEAITIEDWLDYIVKLKD